MTDLTEIEREAVALALKHCLGHEIAVSPMEINPIWRSALEKMQRYETQRRLDDRG